MRQIIRNVADCVILGLFCVGCTLPVVVIWMPRSQFLITFDLTPEFSLLFVAFTFGVCLGVLRIRNTNRS